MFFVPEFMAKTQKHSIPNSGFERFTVPSVHDFVGVDEDEFFFFFFL